MQTYPSGHPEKWEWTYPRVLEGAHHRVSGTPALGQGLPGMKRERAETGPELEGIRNDTG